MFLCFLKCHSSDSPDWSDHQEAESNRSTSFLIGQNVQWSVKRVSGAQRHPECFWTVRQEQGCDWSVEKGGWGFVDPECLDGGEDFLLVASEGHAHSEQVFSVEL